MRVPSHTLAWKVSGYGPGVTCLRRERFPGARWSVRPSLAAIASASASPMSLSASDRDASMASPIAWRTVDFLACFDANAADADAAASLCVSLSRRAATSAAHHLLR